MLDKSTAMNFINKTWDESITPTLVEFIKIPNKSPMFDANWVEHGYMEQAVNLLSDWCNKHPAKDMQIDVMRLEGRTPLIYIDIPGQNDDTVLLYGHLDKQPEMVGWDADLGPWKPVLKDEKLYGRGGADDGYAVFAALTAINALQQQSIPHSRCVIIIEACEESGSYDLPFYIDHIKGRLGEPSLVVCLDSGAGNYDQMWSTTSLRGLVGGTLSVEMLTEGVHSGMGSGVIASTFRIARDIISRIEDPKTGEVLVQELHVDIPQRRQEQAQTAADILGDEIITAYPLVDGAKTVTDDLAELVLNRTWRPALSTTGVGGIPAIEEAGNVLRPKTELKLSMRIPPTCHPDTASKALKTALEANAPYGAKVTFTEDQIGPGWNAPTLADWLLAANEEASNTFFGKPAAYIGEGGSIPFMGMLGEKFPQAQFLITGVLGPHSNAHGPNEFLHLGCAKKLTAAVAHVLAKQFLC